MRAIARANFGEPRRRYSYPIFFRGGKAAQRSEKIARRGAHATRAKALASLNNAFVSSAPIAEPKAL